MRIGVLGGTFNPPHLGHLVCAQEAYLHLELTRVILIPARIPPHKPVDEEPGVDHRLEMCRLAIAGHGDQFAVSDIETRREGPSYTVDTLEELDADQPGTELFLIVGADVAIGFPSWREPERVLSLATLAVAQRPGTSRDAVERSLTEVPGGEAAEFFPMPEIGISSTMLRERARASEPTTYLMPDAVRSYIDRHRLYGAEAGHGA
ncbi:MAG TPA: nicotinate-nucleotide adenylyltransferase [Solirubrobacteraceae bacterium]|nr:nicotinate-nucleotide adenylyltransferase [Solirubrobacteraceae bacterium]